MNETKVCPKCGEEKSKLDFHRNKNAADGCQTYCKACTKGRSTRYSRYGTTVKKKTCVTCLNAFPVSNFYPSSDTPDGRERSCKKCSEQLNREASMKPSAIQKIVPRRCTVEHEPGSPGYRRMEERRNAKTMAAHDALRAATLEAMGR